MNSNISEALQIAMGATEIRRRAMSAPQTLNEAYDYARPAHFSRGMRLDLGGVVVLLISGTASIDEHGKTVNVGDFRAQMRRAYQNLTGLLEAEGATWKDVVRTGCYLRDMERDYAAFNEERAVFFGRQGIELYPASTAF